MIPPIEPSADSRNAAKGLREVYVALLHEGFDEEQALALVIASMQAGSR